MPRGTRLEGRVALWDFHFSDDPPTGWRDGYVYSMGLFSYQFKTLSEDANEATKKARSFLFAGYHRSEPYPHIISLRPEPLFAILNEIRVVRNIDPDNDVSSQYVRLTPAKVNVDQTRAVLSSGDSRTMFPTVDPKDVDWTMMHYDERLLCPKIYREIISEDNLAFLKALGIRLPADPLPYP